MSITMPVYVKDVDTLNAALASQGYPSMDNASTSHNAGGVNYFYACKLKETTVNFRLKYDVGMQFHTIEELTIYGVDENKTLTTNPSDPHKFNVALEVIMTEANKRLSKSIEYDGHVRPNHMATFMAKVIEQTYQAYQLYQG